LSTAEREEVVQMLMRLPVAICVGSGERRFNVLHAEFTGRDEDLYSGSPFIAAHLESIVWGNSLASRRHESEPVFKQPGLSTTYVGHTVVKRVASIGSLVYLDTGAYRQDGRLTMLEPRTGYQYTAKKKELELA